MFKKMKRIQYLVVAIVAVVIFSGDVVAQQPVNNAKFGRGRLLRKWRNDFSGNTQKQKSPTPAKQGKQPTPAKRPDSTSQSNAATQRTGNQKYSRNVATRPSSTRQQATRNAKKRGFGMLVEVDKNEKLVVSQVDSNGNAVAAGIRRGDFITQLGGVDLGSLDEFKEIGKVLGEGDEMDLQISRRGQKKDVKVQYGEIPEIKQTEEQTADDANPVSPTNAGNPVTGPYEFVPQKNSQFRSVLDGPVSYRSNQRTPARPASSGARLIRPKR
jgi:C-terminal processing protease CtpA/Prc